MGSRRGGVLSEYSIASLTRSFSGPIDWATVRRCDDTGRAADNGRGVLGLVVVMMRSESVNQIELLTLRHEIAAVLRRQASLKGPLTHPVA